MRERERERERRRERERAREQKQRKVTPLPPAFTDISNRFDPTP